MFDESGTGEISPNPNNSTEEKIDYREQNATLFSELDKARQEKNEAEILRVRNQIVELNKPFAEWVAGKFGETKDSERGDIESAAYRGLIYAVDHFDYTRGFQLSSYTFRCTTGFILSELNQASTRKGLTRDAYSEMRKASSSPENFSSFSQKLYNEIYPGIVYRLKQQHMESDYQPTQEEIVDQFAQEMAKRERLFTAISQEPISLNQKREIYSYRVPGISPLDQEIPDDLPESDPEEMAHQMLLSENIYKALNTLTPKQAFVIAMRYGFLDLADKLIQKIPDSKRIVSEQKAEYLKLRQETEELSAQTESYYTLEQIGKIFGVGGMMVSHIEGQALKALRHPARSKNLRDYL
jgi:RNA polymerase sigma factor (sigma-70 family)